MFIFIFIFTSLKLYLHLYLYLYLNLYLYLHLHFLNNIYIYVYTGGVAAGDATKKAAKKMLAKKLPDAASNSRSDSNLKYIYTHEDFRQDEDFILRLVESRKIEEVQVVEETIKCYLNYLQQSRRQHPIFRHFSPDDPYLALVSLSRYILLCIFNYP